MKLQAPALPLSSDCGPPPNSERRGCNLSGSELEEANLH
jgi:hypothetical protein